MNKLQRWISSEPTKLTDSQEADRAILAWNRILRGGSKSPMIEFTTSSGKIDEQRVRIESDSRSTSPVSAAGTAPKRQVVIFGIKGHPVEPDTDVEKGYTFPFEGEKYVIKDVIYTLGEKQALAEATR